MECGRREWNGVHRKFCYDREVVLKETYFTSLLKLNRFDSASMLVN